MVVSDLAVAISNAAGGSLPNKFSPIPTHFQAVAELSGLCLITHEAKKCHVDWSHAKLKCFEMKAEIVTITMEHLKIRSNIKK